MIKITETDDKNFIADIPLDMILKEHPEFEDKRDILPDPYPLVIPKETVFNIAKEEIPEILREAIIKFQKGQL